MLYNPPQVSPQATTKFPNGSSVTEFTLGTNSTMILPDRGTTQNRRGLIVFNDGTANALFAYGTTISATSYTAELLPGGYIEDSVNWQGPVTMRSTSVPTTVNVTELVII